MSGEENQDTKTEPDASDEQQERDDAQKDAGRHRKYWWLAAAALVLGLIVWGQLRPPEVTVAEVTTGDLAVTVTATGEVEGQVADLSPSVQGRVEAVYRDEGDHVRRGDLLCRIASGPTMTAGAAAQTAHETVQAPFDGVVSRRYIDPGDSAIPGSPVFQIADPNEIWVVALVEDIDAGKVHVGQQVSIVLPAYLGESLPGRVRRVGATATPRTQAGVGGQVIRTRIELTEETGPLRPGMQVDVTAEATIARDVVLAPANAVIEDQTGRWAMVVENGQIQRREVTLGSSNYLQAEIVDGLKPGDRVVVEGKDAVEPGDRVRVQAGGAR